MGRDRRMRKKDFGGKRGDDKEEVGIKGTLYTVCVIVLLGVIAFFGTILIYNKNLEKVYGDLEMQELGQNPIDDYNPAEEASSEIGKTVNEAQETEETNAESEEQNLTKQEIEDPSHTGDEETVPQEQNLEETEEQKQEVKPQEVPDPIFEMPVAGEVKKEFANDSLVYSETLKEWVTHTGIDIEADKATVVKAAEAGKVTAIKNDPRYGITVIIEHVNGYETRYANLLTAEFVNVGEEVTKGQTIGTVGDTATFEVLDNYHLHFEILKNGEYQNPSWFLNM